MPKLEIELIPRTCHYKNARQKLKPSQWDVVRRWAYQQAGHKCQICGLTGKEQGYKNNLECHEIWDFDNETLTQRLKGVIALCPLCHQTKHFGLASKMGRQADIFAQLQKINKWNHKQVVQHVAECFVECQERGKHRWKLDLSILNGEPFNMPPRSRLKPKKRRRAKRKT